MATRRRRREKEESMSDTMKSNTENDEEIIAEALWCALKYIEGLPEALQDQSMARNMKAVLLARHIEFVKLQFDVAQIGLLMHGDEDITAHEREKFGGTDDDWRQLQAQTRRHMRPPKIIDKRELPDD
jgi:hypothetical protein